MYKFLALPVLSGHCTSRNPVQSINSYIWVSSKNPSVGSYQGWKDKTLTCYALTRSKGELMTEMWLLLECPERIIRADFLFSWGRPPSMSSRDCLTALLPDFPLPSLQSLPTPLSLGVCAAAAAPLWSSSDTRQVFFPACESTVYNGVALHRRSLRSFMALAGMREPIAGTSSWYMTLI